MKKFSTAQFLLNILTNSPEKSEYFREFSPEGIRTNFFYITDLAKTSFANVNAGDNGAYLKSQITNKSYYIGKDQVITLHELNDKFYCNKRDSYNSYIKVNVSADSIVTLHRTYGKAKSFPLTRTIITMLNRTNGPIHPYVAVFYQPQQINESAEVLSHGNAKQNGKNKPYFKTSNDILKKTKEKFSKGIGSKKVYDQINTESRGVFFSCS